LTTYSALHFVLVGVCVLVGLFFLVLHRSARVEQSLLWIALSFLMFALVDLCLAGASTAAEGGAGDPRRWLWGAVAVTPVLAATILRTAWAVMGYQPTGWRRWLPWPVIACGTVFAIDLAIRIVRGTAAPSFEQSVSATSRLPGAALWVSAFAVCGLAAFDALRGFRSNRLVASAVLAVVASSTILFGREILVGLAIVSGPSLLALASIPLLVFGAVVASLRLVHRLRGGEIGSYTIVRRIGGGGMGEMFLAARKGPAGFHRNVALKRMRFDQKHPHGVERFLGEARLAAQLHHANIVGVHDLGEMDGGWFIAMEYVAGVTAAQLVGRARRMNQRIPPTVVATIGVEISRGLAYAHAAGIMHRDISADNIMIGFTGDVKIIDFGVAKVAESLARAPVAAHGPSDVTQVGGFVGKVAYAAPERLTGQPASPSTDVFSVGVVLYELLAAKRPFDSESGDTGVWHTVLSAPYEPLSAVRDDLPPALEACIDRALARRPEARVASATDLAAALRACPLASAGELAELTQALFAEEWAAERADPGAGTARTHELAPVEVATAATVQLNASSGVANRTG
jgi:eukaryotic-like serine/threonine-protein kinase